MKTALHCFRLWVMAAVMAPPSLWRVLGQQPQGQLRARNLNLFDDIHETSERRSTPHSISDGETPDDNDMGDSLGGDSHADDSLGDTTTAATSSVPARRALCKSIIAIGNTRLPSYYKQSSSSESDRDLQDSSWRDAVLDGVQSDFENDGAPSDGSGDRAGEGSVGDVGGEDEGEEFVCELYNGATIPIHSTSDQLLELRRALNDGTLVSAVSSIGVVEEEEQVEAEEMIVGMKPPGDAHFGDIMFAQQSLNGVTLPSGSIQLQTDPHRRLSHQQRSLAKYSGTKPVLIVRVTDVLGRAVPEDANTISDKFFGTNGDNENMKSQFASCSMNTMNIVYNSYGSKTGQIVPKLSAPGVLEVTIPISLDSTQSSIRSHVQEQVQEKLGLTLPDPVFAHVLVVLQDCYQGCGWAAYAYVNSWLSVYQDKYYAFPAVQMHELGHNLNLAHSGGLDGETYTDHTCLMGNPLFSDHVGDMCFNPAKNYQIVMTGESRPGKGNWYDQDRVETYDMSVNGKKWDGRLTGIAEYDKLNQGNSKDNRIVLKLETGTSSDLYVGFNRAVGINADNKQASNQVTIVEMGGNGRAYSQSMLKATLWPGETYKVPNWQGRGEELVLSVEGVTTNVSPWYAQVKVVVGDGGVVATPNPTKQPTKQPTNIPTKQPTNFPTKQPTKQPTKFPTNQPTNFPTKQPTNWPTKQPTNWPTKQPTNWPTKQPTNFPTKQPTPNPTNYPTKLPTNDPTKQPANFPTKHPTTNPTNYPIKSPTNDPTKQPTNFPTNPPTSEPTNPPNASPTSNPTKAPTYLPTPLTTGGGDTIKFPNPIFTPDRVANGTMFTVEALQEDVSISSLSTSTSEVGVGTIQVYTRQGHYEGHTASEEGWTLIYDQFTQQKGLDMLTRLGPFSDDQVVTIPAGEFASFYVYTTKKLRYHQYSNAEGEAVADDGSLRLYAGIGLAYGKWEEGCGVASPQGDGECKFGPRVFSGSLEYSLSSTTTSTTSATTISTTTPLPFIEFSTPDRKGANDHKGKGIMFTLQAKQNIVIEGMDIVAKTNTASDVSIYTQSGSYNDKSLTSDDGWTLLYDGSIPDQESKLYELYDFSEGVSIAAGQIQSFYVYSRKGLVYTGSDEEGTAYGEDSSIIIHEGRLTKKRFRKPLHGSGKWAGIIRYNID